MRPEEIGLVDTPGGCRLRVKVRPGGRTEEITGPHGGALKLSVTAPPERGKANHAATALLAKILGLPASKVAVAAGHASPGKTIRIEGLSGSEVLSRLEAASS